MKYSKDNIFCQIINGNLSCKKFYEDDDFLVIFDKFPRYETHLLLMPKKEFISFDDFLKNSTENEIGKYFKILQKIVTDLDLSEKGYRVLTNHKKSMGQEIFHFHTHIMSGKTLNDLKEGM